MREVSQEWIDNQKRQFTSQSHIRISIQEEPLFMPATTVGSHSPVMSISNILGEILNDNMGADIIDYGTLEINRWLLDGSVRTASDFARQSQASFIFSTLAVGIQNPFINVWDLPTRNNGERRENWQAITITFDSSQGEYAYDFNVTFQTTPIANNITIPIRNNRKNRVIIPIDVSRAWTGVEIQILNWSMLGRRVRIDNITLGHKQIWTDSDVIRYNYRGTNSTVLSRLPEEEINFEISDKKQLHNPLRNAETILDTTFLINVEYGFNINNQIEWLEPMDFKLETYRYKRNSNSLKITGVRNLHHLMNLRHRSVRAPIIHNPGLSVIRPPMLPTSPNGVLFTIQDQFVINGVNSTIEDLTNNANPWSRTSKIYNANLMDLLKQATLFVNGLVRIDKIDKIQVIPYTGNIKNYKITTNTQIQKVEIVKAPIINIVKVNITRLSIDDLWSEWVREGNAYVSRRTPIARINIDGRTGLFELEFTYRIPNSNLGSNDITFNNHNNTNNNVKILNVNQDVIPGNRITLLESRWSGARIRVDLSGLPTTGNDKPVAIEIFGSVNTFTNNEIFTLKHNNNINGIDIDIPNNILVTAESHAIEIGNRLVQRLERNEIELNCRIDPRLELLDNIEVDTEHGVRKMTVTQLEVNYDGWYSGRIGGVLFNE